MVAAGAEPSAVAIGGCLSSGLSSGEGLTWKVRDAVDDQDAGAPDKRRLILEPEFAQVLKVLAHEGNTLSPVVRNAWDGKTLQTITRHTPVRASDAHVGIVGHITKDEQHGEVRRRREGEPKGGLPDITAAEIEDLDEPTSEIP